MLIGQQFSIVVVSFSDFGIRVMWALGGRAGSEVSKSHVFPLGALANTVLVRDGLETALSWGQV